MQEQIDSTSDSGEFQEVESDYSWRLSYVSSQPAMTPNARSMLSREKRLPPNTWNTSGLHQIVFGFQFSTFDWVASRKTWMHWFLKEDKSLGEWDRFEEYGSLSLRYVKQVSRKEKTIAW